MLKKKCFFVQRRGNYMRAMQKRILKITSSLHYHERSVKSSLTSQCAYEHRHDCQLFAGMTSAWYLLHIGHQVLVRSPQGAGHRPTSSVFQHLLRIFQYETLQNTVPVCRELVISIFYRLAKNICMRVTSGDSHLRSLCERRAATLHCTSLMQ